eukprot:scaffold268_cov236-Pinguiococcus_pyrenoidosus.AAC.15
MEEVFKKYQDERDVRSILYKLSVLQSALEEQNAEEVLQQLLILEQFSRSNSFVFHHTRAKVAQCGFPMLVDAVVLGVLTESETIVSCALNLAERILIAYTGREAHVSRLGDMLDLMATLYCSKRFEKSCTHGYLLYLYSEYACTCGVCDQSLLLKVLTEIDNAGVFDVDVVLCCCKLITDAVHSKVSCSTFTTVATCTLLRVVRATPQWPLSDEALCAAFHGLLLCLRDMEIDQVHEIVINEFSLRDLPLVCFADASALQAPVQTLDVQLRTRLSESLQKATTPAYEA